MTSLIAYLCQRKVSVGIGIELLEELTPLGQVSIIPLEWQLGIDLFPIDGSHCRFLEANEKKEDFIGYSLHWDWNFGLT